MKSYLKWTDGPVLLLYNIDPCWNPTELNNVLELVEQMKSGLRQEGHNVTLLETSGPDIADILTQYDPREYVVFNWCDDLPGIHQGEVIAAEVLEKNNFCYTGSPPEVLSLSWDKAAVKKQLEQYNIATPSWRLFSTPHANDWNNFPAIVKPAFEHCSNGITTDAVVLDARELAERVAYVLDEFHQPALVEDFIDGREFHVTLWGNGTIEMLPPAEMDFSAFDNIKYRLCTFDSKFIPGSLHYEKIEMQVPAVLDEQLFRQIKLTSQRAYHAIGCRDYARIDLRLRQGIFYVLDVNPNADITPDTSLAYAVEAAGLSYGFFASTLVQLAARRHSLSFPELMQSKTANLALSTA
jgi:D-alanine-D-alanine ligase